MSADAQWEWDFLGAAFWFIRSSRLAMTGPRWEWIETSFAVHHSA